MGPRGTTHLAQSALIGLTMLSMGSLGACSYVSALTAVQDLTGGMRTGGDRTQDACARARTNRASATDPVEARQWEILMEDLDCPTQREFLNRD